MPVAPKALPRNMRPSSSAKAASVIGRYCGAMIGRASRVVETESDMKSHLAGDQRVPGAALKIHTEQRRVRAFGFEDVGGDAPSVLRVKNNNIGGGAQLERAASFS